jgi:hypothetical protein
MLDGARRVLVEKGICHFLAHFSLKSFSCSPRAMEEPLKKSLMTLKRKTAICFFCSSSMKKPLFYDAHLLQRLFHRLSDNENRYIRHKTIDGMSDVSIRKRLRIIFTHLYLMKRNIRRQIEIALAA